MEQVKPKYNVFFLSVEILNHLSDLSEKSGHSFCIRFAGHGSSPRFQPKLHQNDSTIRHYVWTCEFHFCCCFVSQKSKTGHQTYCERVTYKIIWFCRCLAWPGATYYHGWDGRKIQTQQSTRQWICRSSQRGLTTWQFWWRRSTKLSMGRFSLNIWNSILTKWWKTFIWGSVLILWETLVTWKGKSFFQPPLQVRIWAFNKELFLVSNFDLHMSFQISWRSETWFGTTCGTRSDCSPFYWKQRHGCVVVLAPKILIWKYNTLHGQLGGHQSKVMNEWMNELIN